MLEIARDRRIILKKEKEISKIRKSQQQYIFLTFNFLYRTIYILLENVLGKTYFLLLHFYYSFLCDRLLEMQQYTNALIDMHWLCTRCISTQNLDNWTLILIAIDYYFFFFTFQGITFNLEKKKCSENFWFTPYK